VKKFLPLIAFMIVGCSTGNNAVVSSKTIQAKQEEMLLDEDQEEDNQELYFLATKNKILYSKTIYTTKDQIDYFINNTLENLFRQARPRLPKRHRHKLNIAIYVDASSYKNEITDAVQAFVLKHKRFNLVSIDSQSLKALRKIINKEKDSTYTGGFYINPKHRSDIVIFIKASKNKDNLYIKAKLISKNASILGSIKEKINLNKSLKWAQVKVPRNTGGFENFEIMIKPVSKKEFYGFGDDTPVTNVTFQQASAYCMKINAQLSQPYVFEYARRYHIIQKPLNVPQEMIAPYDDEDQDIYYQEGDKLESEDGTIIIFDWNKEKYYSVSNLYTSSNTTFRCIKVK